MERSSSSWDYLAVGFVCQVLDLSLEFGRLQDQFGHVSDGDFVGFVDAEDQRRHRVVVPQGPDEKATQVQAVDELPQRLARSPYLEWLVITFGDVGLVYQAWWATRQLKLVAIKNNMQYASCLIFVHTLLYKQTVKCWPFLVLTPTL